MVGVWVISVQLTTPQSLPKKKKRCDSHLAIFIDKTGLWAYPRSLERNSREDFLSLCMENCPVHIM